MQDERYRSEAGDFNIALSGDVMLNRRISLHDEPAFLKLRSILQSADAAFANLETVVRNPDQGSPTFPTRLTRQCRPNF